MIRVIPKNQFTFITTKHSCQVIPVVVLIKPLLAFYLLIYPYPFTEKNETPPEPVKSLTLAF